MTVATDPTAIVTLAELRHECRVDDASEDSALESARDDAIAFVSEWTGRPLLDRTVVEHAHPRYYRDDCPAFVLAAHVRSATAKFWRPTDANANAEPAGQIEAVGRIQPVESGGTLIHPPPAGWPARLPGSAIVFVLVVGADTTGDLKRAILAASRHFYDGHGEIPATLATILNKATVYP